MTRSRVELADDLASDVKPAMAEAVADHLGDRLDPDEQYALVAALADGLESSIEETLRQRALADDDDDRGSAATIISGP